MLTCDRNNAKSTAGRLAALGGAAGLTGEVGGFTVELAVVTTFLAGKSRLWPTAFFSSAEGMAAAASAVAAGGMAGVTVSGFPHGK